MPNIPKFPEIAKPDATPDAILCPRSFPVPPEHPMRAAHHKQIFAPLLGENRVITRQSGAHQSLITRFSEPDRNHRYWPKGHENEGAEFYRWAKSNVDGVYFGYLTDAAKEHVASGRPNLANMGDVPDADAPAE